MNLKVRCLFLLLVIFIPGWVNAQELNCDVTVNSDQIQESDKSVYASMKTAIREFMNNTKWTDDKFQPGERINCAITITLTSHNADQFSGSIQVQSSRPIYGTAYNSPTLTFLDHDFAFRYIQYQPINYSPGTFTSNLSSVLSFYANIILGIDYDTFSELGGTKFYQKAQDVVVNAQSSNYKGWQSSESLKNRYHLMDQLLDQRFIPLRKCLYEYHRQGLDLMYKDAEKGRANILLALTLLEKVQENVPNSLVMRVFFDTKSDEIISIFSQATPSEKDKVLQVLSKTDMSNISKYQEKIK